MPNFNGLWTSRQQMQARGGNTWPAVPGAPTSPVATAGNASASVAFTAPADTGFPANAITGYRVTSSPGGFTGTGLTSPVTVTGLTNGTAYTFTVAAQNVNGYGPESVASNSVTPVVPNYIEEVFSTYLYTGNASTQTITNNINLSGLGGLVWLKSRGATARNHFLTDTVRGAGISVNSNTTAAQETDLNKLSAFTSSGFSIGSSGNVNASATNFASWTFREQPKFFDIVTWTGNGLSSQTIPHSLGSDPGCILNKDTTNVANWWVYHRSTGTGNYLVLNTTAAQVAGSVVSATSASDFTVTSTLTSAGATYVAYLFAHNAGGFGLTGNDNVISCGSYTGTAVAGLNVTLGYEPQWVLIKRATGTTNDWLVFDNMRGIGNGSSSSQVLYPNLTTAEAADTTINISATGFQLVGGANVNASGATYIYMAIRRGPMKVPTLGTTVFGISARTGTNANATVTGGSGVDDAVFVKNRGAAVASLVSSRLTNTGYLVTSTRDAEVAAGVTILQANPWDVMDGVKVGTTSTITNASANTFVNYLFSRAPGFFDVVAYTGTGSTTTVAHNLGVAPELIIVKSRSNLNTEWNVYAAPLGATKYLWLQSTNAVGTGTNRWNDTAPTSSVFTVATDTSVNGSGYTLVAYLFATVAGVSKVGSYTGTGATQTIACGFAAGARYVLIKRTDTTGDWYVWDSVRGMVAGTDPSILLNTAAAEVNANSIYTITTGFQIVSTAAGINASGGTYIFLAIA